MEVTLGGFSSSNPDSHARQGSLDPNYNYANVDRSVVGRNTDDRLTRRTDLYGTPEPSDPREREDSFELSKAARQMYGMDSQNPEASMDRQAVGTGEVRADSLGQEKQGKEDSPEKPGSEDSLELSPDAKRLVESLKATDKMVRAHEAAHLAAGAGIVKGGAQFSTERGPDGNSYAVGGEVSIDTSPVANDPQATMAKARQIIAAALAPADPSPQDRSVAANARQMESSAAVELAKAQTTIQDGDVSLTGRQAVNAYSASSEQNASDSVSRAFQTVA
ncbi:MAG: hypothetical protein FWG02_10915 [Holophagaceae bacterium]|nr:hypothetical protein [Holophagaceae bacterium]